MRWAAGFVAVAGALVTAWLAWRRTHGAPDEGRDGMSLTRPSTLQDAVAYALAGLWWGLMMCALQGEASYVVVGLLFFGPGLFVTDLVIRRWRARPSRPEVGRG